MIAPLRQSEPVGHVQQRSLHSFMLATSIHSGARKYSRSQKQRSMLVAPESRSVEVRSGQREQLVIR